MSLNSAADVKVIERVPPSIVMFVVGGEHGGQPACEVGIVEGGARDLTRKNGNEPGEKGADKSRDSIEHVRGRKFLQGARPGLDGQQDNQTCRAADDEEQEQPSEGREDRRNEATDAVARRARGNRMSRLRRCGAARRAVGRGMLIVARSDRQLGSRRAGGRGRLGRTWGARARRRRRTLWLLALGRVFRAMQSKKGVPRLEGFGSIWILFSEIAIELKGVPGLPLLLGTAARDDQLLWRELRGRLHRDTIVKVRSTTPYAVNPGMSRK